MLDSHIYGNMSIVKTTVDLETGLFKAARKLAIDQGRPFRAVLNDALRVYLEAGAIRQASEPGRRRRRTAPVAAATANRATPASEAEFWAIVNDRSRWDEMFGDRLQKIESDIARAAADWEQRKRA